VVEVALIFEFPVDPVFAFTLILEKTPKFLAAIFKSQTLPRLRKRFLPQWRSPRAGNEAQNK
jgi:hypothetical protein